MYLVTGQLFGIFGDKGAVLANQNRIYLPIMKWFFKCIRHYADFKGRARRKEYWMFTLVVSVISYIIYLLGYLLTGGTVEVMPYDLESLQSLDITSAANPVMAVVFKGISTLWEIFLFVPTLAVAVRRLHDIGRSGKLILAFYVVMIVALVCTVYSFFVSDGGESMETESMVLLIPGVVLLVMAVWLLILMTKPGDVGPNRYGSDPKALDEIALS